MRDVTIPETWSTSLVGWTARQQMRYPNEGGSDGKRAYFLAYSSCKSTKDACMTNQKTGNLSNIYPQPVLLFLSVYFLPLAFLCMCFMDITSTVWGGSWSRQGSSQVLAAGDCCSPPPRWWQRSPRLYKGSLLSTFPTAPLQRTLKQSEVLFIQEVWMRSWYV